MPHRTHDEVKRVFVASPILDFLPASEIDALALGALHRHFDTGDTVFAKGAPGSSIYWVLAGRLKLSVGGPDGTELLHSMIEPGGYCGEITAVDGGVRGVDAIADCATDVVSVDRRDLLPAFERNPKATMNLARMLCAQVRIAGNSLENLAFHNAESRLWTRLMFLSREYGELDPSSGALRIRHRLSQQSLADSIGLTRVMVNRQLSAWREQGLIEDGRGFVLVPNPKAFEDFVMRKPA